MRLAWSSALGAALLSAACGLELVGTASSDGGPLPDAGADGTAPPSGDSAPPPPPPSGDAAADGAIDAPNDARPATGRKKALTIARTKVTGTLTDFPMWVDLMDPDVAARARSDGKDLFFTAEDGSPVPYALQTWDGQSGHLMAWVRVPQLSTTADTTIFLRYGDVSTATPPAPKAVFSSGFAAVWHLEDTLATTAIDDATGTHAGTAVGVLSTQQVPAKLGGGISFDGGSDEISFTNPLANADPHTISLWVSQRTTTNNDALVVLGNGQCGQSRWLHGRYNGPTLAVGFYCNDWGNPGVSLENAGWTLIHWVYEGGGNGASRIYRDGALVAGPFPQQGTAVATQGEGGHLGNAPSAWGASMGATATVDEVRIATVARAPEWILAEFVSQSTPSKFYVVGPELPAP